MEEKNKFEIIPIEEEPVKVTIEEVKESTNFSVEEINELNKPINEGVSNGNIKANDKAKSPVKGYFFGALFIAFGIACLVVAFTVEGYKIAGIICTALAFLAGYAMLKHLFDAKKINALLQSGECKTVEDLMRKMNRKNKYEFLRDLGGMIKAGYVVGYEVVEGNEIRRVN